MIKKILITVFFPVLLFAGWNDVENEFMQVCVSDYYTVNNSFSMESHIYFCSCVFDGIQDDFEFEKFNRFWSVGYTGERRKIIQKIHKTEKKCFEKLNKKLKER